MDVQILLIVSLCPTVSCVLLSSPITGLLSQKSLAKVYDLLLFLKTSGIRA